MMYDLGRKKSKINTKNVNHKDNAGWTPLHFATGYNYISICKLIIENIEDANPENNELTTPLHIAAHYGYLEICDLILNRIDHLPRDQLGWIPLHFASHNGHKEVCQIEEIQ